MTPIRMSKIESAMRVALEFKDAFNQQDVPGMMALISDDCLFENAGPVPDSAVHSGKNAIAQYWRSFFEGFPQANIEIEDIFSLAERCIMRWKLSWMDSTGEDKCIRGVDLFLVREGTIREQISYVKGEMPSE